jgi:hypothetical protein
VIACESFHKFTLPEGSRYHEDVNPNHQTGVDFEIAGKPRVWMEVKSWEAPTIPEAYREEQRDKFASEMERGQFWSSIAAKFRGTHDCLVARNERPEGPTCLLLLECQRFPRGQETILASVLQREAARHHELYDCTAAVLPFDKLPSFVDGASTSPCVLAANLDCDSQVDHCSRERQLHR